MTETAPSEGQRKVTGWQRNVVITLDRLILGFARHWAAVFALAAALYSGLSFAAPVLMEAGHPRVAGIIYTLYGGLCHQMPFRSWFLFGEQIIYPRARAGLAGGTFEQYAAADPAFAGINLAILDANLIFTAHTFVGNPQMGWKVALCQRDVAIYGSIAMFGLVYAALRRLGVRLPYLPFWAYALIAVAPIALDGFSQLFSNPPTNGFGLAAYPIRESTPFLRVVTGALFGIGSAWLAVPYLDETMAATRDAVESKLIRAGIIAAS